MKAGYESCYHAMPCGRAISESPIRGNLRQTTKHKTRVTLFPYGKRVGRTRRKPLPSSRGSSRTQNLTDIT